MSILDSIKNDRIIGKLTASILILGASYMVLTQPESLTPITKDILLLTLGGAIALLFGN